MSIMNHYQLLSLWRFFVPDFLGAENNLAAAENFNGKLDKLTVLAELLSVFLHQIHILPSNGYPGENQRKFLELLKSCLLGLVLFPIDQLQKTNEEVRLTLNDKFIIY